MRSLQRRAARWLLAVARSPAGGRLAAFACARFPRLLPVQRVALTRDVVAFHHPRPEARDHIVLVPRSYIPSLPALVASGPGEVFAALLDVAGALSAARSTHDGEERLLAVNLGGRQDIAQLHAHLLPARALRQALTEVIEERAVDPADAVVLHRCLQSLVRRIEVVGGRRGGSVLARSLVDPACRHEIRLAATVTREAERPGH